MKNQVVRWLAGNVIRAVYRERSVTRRGDTGAEFRFRPSENPVLLRGPSKVNKHLRDQWRSVLRPGDTIFDIGANIGFTVQRFHGILGGACPIVAFEPMPRNLELLEANVRALGPSQIRIVEKAVGSENGTTVFRQNREHGALSRMASAAEQAADRYEGYWRSFDEVEVEVIRLDSFLDDNPELRPTFLKVDVEGAGGMVFSGGKETISRLKPAMDCEFHGEGESSRMLEMLSELGYGGILFEPNGELKWTAPSDRTTVFVHPEDPRVASLSIGGDPATAALR